MPDPETDAAVIAAKLTEAQRVLINGDYDPEFARIEDASALERLGLWLYDPAKQGADGDYYEFDITPLGLAVRQHLLGEQP